MNQDVGGGGGLRGAGGEANPQPNAAVMCNRSRLLLGASRGSEEEGRCYLWWLWEATGCCSRGLWLLRSEGEGREIRRRRREEGVTASEVMSVTT